MKIGIWSLAMAAATSWLAVVPMAAAADCTYAAPTGSANGTGEFDDPIRIADFWDPQRDLADPGATLCLKSGVYTGADSMLRPPAYIHGAPGNPIKVLAIEDGGVLIDGEGLRSPIVLEGDYWTVERVNAARGNPSVVSVNGRHNVVKRVVAWDASGNNAMVFNIDGAEDALLEDVAGFGSGRKVFQVNKSLRVTIRRAWARWQFGGWSNPRFAFSCAYSSYDVTCENLLATVAPGETNNFGLIAMDYFDTDAPTPIGRDRFESGLRVLGSIAYQRAGSVVPDSTNIRFKEIKDAEVIDLVSYAAPGVSPTPRLFDLNACSAECLGDDPDANNLALHLTQIGDPSRSDFTSDWGPVEGMDLVTEPESADIFTGSSGAQVCHRYMNGVLTDAPLWPWPMNSRILSAAGVDVTQEIEAIFGPIPAACRPPDGNCGLGMELCLILPPLMVLRKRLRRRDR